MAANPIKETEQKPLACKYRGIMKIAGEKWDWCFLFNAEIEDVTCEKCECRDMEVYLVRRLINERLTAKDRLFPAKPHNWLQLSLNFDA
jgi:hypothetical protein